MEKEKPKLDKKRFILLIFTLIISLFIIGVILILNIPSYNIKPNNNTKPIKPHMSPLP